MNFNELVSEVLELVRRPDKLDLIQRQVKAATLKMHHAEFFKKDLAETGVELEYPGFTTSFIPKSLIPRFRAVHYIRSASNGCPGQFLEAVHPQNIFDDYGQQRVNIYYQAGSVIQIRTNYFLSHILFGCYLNPDIRETHWDSWISDEQPFAIIYETARVVFKAIGFDEQSAQMNALVQEQLAELIPNGLVTEV